jgi:predicted negative regulator of RcsB-dependent stress response
MAAKLSKKELKKPDAFQTTMESVMHYMAVNKKRLYAIVTSAIIAAIIAFGIYMYWSNYQTSAKEMYARAQNSIYRNNNNPEELMRGVRTLQELINKYPHSWSAKMARYHLGNIYYSSGEIDKAVDEFKKFVSYNMSGNAGVKFLAMTSLGYCYEAKKDFSSALTYFEKAQKIDDTGFEAIGFRNIARICELAGDKKKALENYKNALQKTTDPSMTIFIKRKISSLS